MRRVQVQAAQLASLACIHGNPKVYLFAELGAARVFSRCFFPNANGQAIAADPATGSVCANLGGYYLAMNALLPLSRTIYQEEQTGRPSTLYLDVDEARAIIVSGEVIELGSGVIDAAWVALRIRRQTPHINRLLHK